MCVCVSEQEKKEIPGSRCRATVTSGKGSSPSLSPSLLLVSRRKGCSREEEEEKGVGDAFERAAACESSLPLSLSSCLLHNNSNSSSSGISRSVPDAGDSDDADASRHRS